MEIITNIEYLTKIYGKEKVMTINELKKRMKVSEITIRRKLKQSGAITSYNKNGRYYTLAHIPTFDSYGLWNYNDIRFSKYGNLNQTITQLINQSSCGLHAEAIGELIAYPPHSLLKQLWSKSALQREKLHGRYIYFSIDEELHQSQLHEYTSKRAKFETEEMPCITVVKLLIEKIKRPKDSVPHIVKILHRENVKITELQVKHFFEKHGIEKKTGLR